MDERTTIADLERRLTDSETRHRLLIQSWAQAEWETDAEGVVVADSPSWRAYTGQTIGQFLGHGWLDAIHPDDRAHAERQWRDATAARSLVNAEFRLHAPDGGWRWTNVRAAPVLDASGDIAKWVGMNIDIDDRKRAEETLSASESRLRTLFDSIDEGYAEFDVILGEGGQVVDWRYVALNAAFTRLTGMEDVTGRLISEIVPDLEPEWKETYTRLLETGESIRFEQAAASLDQWYEVYASRSGGPGSRRIVVVYNNVTERERAEIALRASQERQAFLLKLSDGLRPVTDPLAIQDIAARTLGEHLDADRTYYAVVQGDYEFAVVEREYLRGDAPSVVGTHPFATYGTAFDAFRNGRTMAVDDVEAAEAIRSEDLLGFRALSIRSLVNTPLVKGGRSVAGMTVLKATPHEWTAEQISLVEEVAERTWAAVERARAEAALRASEERFAQFASSSSDGLWIRDATLTMEYTSPAIGQIFGVPPDALLGDAARWAALIVPEDRDTALAHLDQARRGEAVVHEFRIRRPSDGTFRWIRDTDFPLREDGDVPRIGGIAQDVTEAKLLAEHQGVLLAELQHRVRNIMALVRSITARTGERAQSVSDYTELMLGRLMAFTRVQALLTRAANVSVGVASIVRDEVSVQAQHEGQYALEGPDIELSPKAAEVLTLAVHELATNAVKYGALSVPDGRITVRWMTFEKRGGPWLSFDWTEEGAPARPEPAPDAPRRRGFGSEMIEGRVPYELKGRGTIAIEPGGARCHLEFPLTPGVSILETGAPQRATVFGGALDMTGEPDLSGHRVLVVEDDYYLATDTARALQGAGAEVLGPCARDEDARAELAEQRPDAVVLDINLGEGASFKLAEHLKDSGISFVFTTGYDQGVIPAEFSGVERLEKPLQLRQVVGAVSKLLSPTE